MSALRDSLSRHALVLLAAIMLSGFVLLTSEMLETETQPIDAWALHWFQEWRVMHAGGAALMRDVTSIGSTVVLTLMTVVLAGYLAVSRRVASGVFVALSMASAALVLRLLKHGIGRARPDPSLAAFFQDGLSFPSGHATMSAVFFLTAGALLAQHCHRVPERIYLMSAAILLTALIGLSRVVLGVHWASDVLAGWVFGSGWAILSLHALQHWRRSRGS